MAEEVRSAWSDWIRHDGCGNLRLVGRYVFAECANGDTGEGVVYDRAMQPPPGCSSLWVWDGLPVDWYGFRVIRYRLRRPLGMAVLDSALMVSRCSVLEVAP